MTDSKSRITLLDFGATRSYPSARVEQYRALFRAESQSDPAGVETSMHAIGYLGAGDSVYQRDAMVNMSYIGFEPARHAGAYDFASADLPARLSDLGYQLSFEHGPWRTPPPDTLFLQRKLAGTFLLCARLGARVDVRALMEPYL